MQAPPPQRRQTVVADGRTSPPVPAAATIVRNLEIARLEEVERAWIPVRASVTSAVEHAHWDWVRKTRNIEAEYYTLVAIECGDQVQGLMAVCNAPRPARLEPSGRSVLYVDYLEAAPWNLRQAGSTPRFLGVGTVLIAEAIRMSQESGLGGCIGLHSLPQAEGFYRHRCKLTPVGADRDYYDLVYFEYAPEQASEWLAGVGLP